MGVHRYDGYPVELSRTPAELRRGGPLWREHNECVFGEVLGMDREVMETMTAEGGHLTILALTAKRLVVSLPALSEVERVEPRSD